MVKTEKVIKSPFKFLDAYSNGDKSLFLGRDRELKELYDKIHMTDLIVIYGPSGSGKTSLVQAGLAKLIRPTDCFPIYTKRDGDQTLIQSIHKTLEHVSITQIDAPPEIGKEKLSFDWLKNALLSLYHDYHKPIYLIIDQFEELFIYGSVLERKYFFYFLKALIASSVQVKIFLCLREDYFGELGNYEKILPRLFENRLRVEKMRDSQIKKVITKTGSRSGQYKIDSPEGELLDLIITNITGKSGDIELVNLQIYMERLFEEAVKNHKGDPPVLINNKLIKKMKKIDDILNDFFKEQLRILEKELDNKVSTEIRKEIKGSIPMIILYQLVSEQKTKRTRIKEELTTFLQERKFIPKEISDFCIDRFEEMRIVKVF